MIRQEGVHDSLLRVVASQADVLEMDADKEDANWTPRGFLKRNAQLTTLSRELSLEELRGHFGKPIVEVAKEFGICTTFLKKICRRCGIKRWPHRQVRSLSRTIQMLHQAEANASSPQERAKFLNQIAQLEAKKRAVIEDPDANGKLKRVKKCASKSKSDFGGDRGIDVDMDASDDEEEEEEEAVRLVQGGQLVGAPSSMATGVDPNLAKSESAAFHSPIRKDASVADRAEPFSDPISVDTAATSSPRQSHSPAAAAAKTPKSSSLSSSSSDGDASESSGVKISPSHRKLLVVSKYDPETRLRSSSMGSLQDEGVADHSEEGKSVASNAIASTSANA